jgi:hypothetical protein
MIFERRAYTAEPGKVPDFYAANVERGFDLVDPMMQRLVGYFTTRTGPVDQVVHFYRYDDLDDWNSRLRGMYGVPELTPYFTKARKILYKQENAFFDLLPVEALNPMWAGENDWLPRDGGKLAPLDDDIVIEERSFQLRPGGIPAFVEACNAHGAAALAPLADRLIGSFVAATGPQHLIRFWWWFGSEEERVASLSPVFGSRSWSAFIDAIAPLVQEQTSLLLQPSPVPEMSPLFGS